MGRGRKNRRETLPHMMQRLEKIREQRDELLAALREIEALPGISSANLYARRAIAKAEAANG